ncbi:MAG: endonuclease/exonuclease/phosphatase family protein [bacterium]|nr:endonuclease/exonuclease/phosphatase family protein [bacterium]
MPTITSTPPQSVQGDLDALSDALDAQIPAQIDDNLLIATWNIRSFGSLTRKWTAAAGDSPKRDLRGLRAIIEIISRFDVVAVQEVTGDLRSLRDMMKFFGPAWSFLMTDITLGDDGHSERMAFVFNRDRVQPSGLAAELVVPPEQLGIGEDALQQQFARTPYAVSFRAGETTFILVALHVTYGDAPEDRVPELKAIAKWMNDWARRSTKWHHNLLVLGDFNIDRSGDPLWEAFSSTGLTVPDALNDVPRSIYDDPGDPSDNAFYDQIAWFTTGSGKRRLDIDFVSAGGFDFRDLVYRNQSLTNSSLSFRMSDHFPLWVEFHR